MLIRSMSFSVCSVLAFAASALAFPSLTYSTYLRDSFTPKAITTDSAGNVYMVPTQLPSNVIFCAPEGTPCIAPLGFSLCYFDPYASFPDFRGRSFGGSAYVTVSP